MTLLQAAITQAGTILMIVLLVGLFVKRRVRLWYAFALLVAAVIVSNVLVAFWPARFYRWSFWLAKETTHNLIRFAMALELALRAFRAFPGALGTARRAILLVLGLTFIAVLTAPVDGNTPATAYPAFIREVLPRVVNGTVWLFTAIAGVILWYRIPVHPFHKAVLLAYVPYLLVFTILLNALGSVGWQRGASLSYAN